MPTVFLSSGELNGNSTTWQWGRCKSQGVVNRDVEPRERRDVRVNTSFSLGAECPVSGVFSMSRRRSPERWRCVAQRGSEEANGGT
ncbi:unnamed protein product [Lota lota]